MSLIERYIVLKKSDVAQLAPEAQRQLTRLCNAVDFIREGRGVKPIEAVVVEHDWPEYDDTVKRIMFRASGEHVVAWEPGWLLVEIALGALMAYGLISLVFR